MDKLATYRQYVRDVLTHYAQVRPAYGDVKMQTVFDPAGDHYQLMLVGWDGSRREFGIVIHIDIKNGQIWIQHDGTEGGVANDFVELGVPKQDIVLAFHSPFKRPYTGFGTGSEAA